MQKFFANTISYVFHPLLFPTYGTVAIISSNPYLFGNFNAKNQFIWVVLVFVLTFIFPTVWLVMMRKLQMIESLELRTNKERIIPFIAIATFYLWAYRMFKPSAGNAFFANEIVSNMLLGATISIFIGFVINIFSKVSLHAMGAGCFFALCLTLVRYSDFNLTLLIIAAIVVAGAIGSARLILGAHSPREVFSGYLIGFAGLFTAFNILPKLFN
ncbi:MAG: phosphatase PAP2 family protein [Chitinophagales bacterium]|nr:phosphatase PAP2 family protein [Chitinophagales bacterium]